VAPVVRLRPAERAVAVLGYPCAPQRLNAAPFRSSNNGVRGFFRRSKDATVGFAARVAINTKLRGIGEMTELSIDTKNKRVRVRLELIGETEPIDIDITEYRLRHTDEGAQLTIERATASREWLNVALREFVIGQSFPVPPKAEALLKLLG
jgi:hypothetical protein